MLYGRLQSAFLMRLAQRVLLPTFGTIPLLQVRRASDSGELGKGGLPAPAWAAEATPPFSLPNRRMHGRMSMPAPPQK